MTIPLKFLELAQQHQEQMLSYEDGTEVGLWLD